MKIKFNDGETFEGIDSKDIIKKLKQFDMSNPESISSYLNTAEMRYKLININLNTDDCKSFIKSLKKNQIIEIKEW
ncbi:MAG: hypothetical protein ACQEQF_07085 [Bacillota bacterium]